MGFELIDKMPYDHPYRFDLSRFGGPTLINVDSLDGAGFSLDTRDPAFMTVDGSNNVSNWSSVFAGGNNAEQGTEANQPTLNATDREVAFVATNYDEMDLKFASNLTEQVLPDLSDSTSGKGFTCTGLDYDSTLDSGAGGFWVGNYGKAEEGDPTFRQSVVSVDITGATKLTELDISSFVTGGIQGVTVDTSDGTLWVAAVDEDKIYHISKAGAEIGDIDVAAGFANGLTYDSSTDTIWVLGSNTLKNYEKDGTLLFTSAVLGGAMDQLAIDATNRLIYISWGTNGSEGNIHIYDIVADRKVGEFSLYDTTAIEGITWVSSDNKLYAANDGYFHNSEARGNVLITYECTAAPAKDWVVAGVFKIPSVTPSVKCIVGIGDPLAQFGFALYFNGGGTTIRSFVSSGSDQSYDWTVPDFENNYRTLYAHYDSSAETVDLYVDGTQIGTTWTSSGSTRAVRPMWESIIGNNLDASSRPLTITYKNISFYNAHSDTNRQIIEGDLAWSAGIEDQLPIGHDWKSTPPTQ